MNNKETKTLLIASFIPKSSIDYFLNYLNNKFEIKRDNVFIYEIDENDIEYLLTFKIKNEKKIDIKCNFNNGTIVNIKNGCIFSINGLNRLIEYENKCERGNINYEGYKINWEKYKNTFILSNKKNKLIIKNIKKIDNNYIKSDN